MLLDELEGVELELLDPEEDDVEDELDVDDDEDAVSLLEEVERLSVR